MRVHLVVNTIPHEGCEVLFAYRSHKDALLKVSRLEIALRNWTAKQERMEHVGCEMAWSTMPPYMWHHLGVVSFTVKGGNKKRKEGA